MSLDQPNPEMQRFMDQALNRSMPDPRNPDPIAQVAWRAQAGEFMRIQQNERKALENPRPTAQDMHLRMKYGPEETPPLLLETIHAMPKPHREFMYGTAGADVLPDARAQQRPRLALDWKFPTASETKPSSQRQPTLDPAEFGHIREYQRLNDSSPTPSPDAGQSVHSRTSAVPPAEPGPSASFTQIIIPDL